MRLLITGLYVSEGCSISGNELLLCYRIESRNAIWTSTLEYSGLDVDVVENIDLGHFAELLKPLASVTQLVPGFVNRLSFCIGLCEEVKWEPLVRLFSVANANSENAVGVSRILSWTKLPLNPLLLTKFRIASVYAMVEEFPLVSCLGKESTERLTYTLKFVKLEAWRWALCFLIHFRDYAIELYIFCHTNIKIKIVIFYLLSECFWALVLT